MLDAHDLVIACQRKGQETNVHFKDQPRAGSDLPPRM